jgi:DNA polymerase
MPEEKAPPHALNCQRCELAQQRTRVIWGEGNPEAPVMLVLDNPGAREDREGHAFLCGTRETLQLGMKEAGLPSEAVYITYILKCRPVRTYNKPAARQACSAHLQLQLTEKKPKLLFGFGNVVAETGLSEKWYFSPTTKKSKPRNAVKSTFFGFSFRCLAFKTDFWTAPFYAYKS